MSVHPALESFKPEKRFYIGIDSDGCAFDSMEIKHKECFAPNFIKYFGLQPVAKYARQAWEFVNLYSQGRGMNRFPAILRSLDLLAERPEVIGRGAAIPPLPHLRDWIDREPKPGNPALEKAIASAIDAKRRAELQLALDWSLSVNAFVADIVHGVPPFPNLVPSLKAARELADIVVVSATPCEALDREWQEHGIASNVRLIAGQEMGKKDEILAVTAKPNYHAANILMIGDAPGDLKAARANGVLFYPIRPDAEDECWKRFHDEAFSRFVDGVYKGAYEDRLVDDFVQSLPTTPPWKTGS